jgi:hypothetical protein
LKPRRASVVREAVDRLLDLAVETWGPTDAVAPKRPLTARSARGASGCAARSHGSTSAGGDNIFLALVLSVDAVAQRPAARF